MVQKHNRNSPMSLHLATIATSDSILLAIGELCYLHPLKLFSQFDQKSAKLN